MTSLRYTIIGDWSRVWCEWGTTFPSPASSQSESTISLLKKAACLTESAMRQVLPQGLPLCAAVLFTQIGTDESQASPARNLVE